MRGESFQEMTMTTLTILAISFAPITIHCIRLIIRARKIDRAIRAYTILN